MTEIDSCPFCGKVPEPEFTGEIQVYDLATAESTYIDSWRIQCSHLRGVEIYVYGNSRQEVIDRWNKREK
jgi:sarcosine oxidase delta subunit